MSELQAPPKGLFEDISKSYDQSIVSYFSLLKSFFLLSILQSLISIYPAYYYYSPSFLGSYHRFSGANAPLEKDENTFLLLVGLDLLYTLIFVCGIYFLRCSINASIEQHLSIKEWSVQVEGFPSSIVDPEELRELFKEAIYEIALVRNFQGSLRLQKEKTRMEQLIRLKSKKMEVLSKSMSEKEVLLRHEELKQLKIQLAALQKELASKTNIFLSPEDLDSVKAYAVFELKSGKENFLKTYSSSCCGGEKLLLRSIYEIRVEEAPDPSEIRWENQDTRFNSNYYFIQLLVVLAFLSPVFLLTLFTQGYLLPDPTKCILLQLPCHELDTTKEALIAACGFCLIVMNEVSLRVLYQAVKKENNLYIVREQFSIFWRSIIFLSLNAVCLVLPEVVSINLFQQVSPSAYLDRNLIQNTGSKLLLAGFFNIFLSFAINELVQCFSNKVDTGEEIEEFQRGLQHMMDESQEISLNQSQTEIHEMTRYRRDSPLINSNSPFQTGIRYAKIFFTLSLSLIFSVALPLLSLFGAFSIGIQYLQDKKMLLRYHSYNCNESLRLSNDYLKIPIAFLQVMQLSVIAHLYISISFFGQDEFFGEVYSVGLSSSFEKNSFIHQALRVLPLTVLMVIVLIVFLIDLAGFCGGGKSNNTKVKPEQDEDVGSIKRYLDALREQNMIVSYELLKNEQYRQIMISQQKESVRAALTKFSLNVQ